MKKIILTITFLFVTFIVFAQEFVITLKKDLILTDDYGVEYNYKKGNKFIYNVNKNGFGVSIDEPLKLKIYFNDSEDNRYDSQINDVYLEDYDFKISENVSKDYWIPSYYYEILKSNSPLDDVLKYEKYWETKTIYSRYDELTWISEFGILRYYFGDFYFVVFGNKGYYDVDFFAYLEEVSDAKIVYNVQRMYSHLGDYNRKYMAYENQPEFLPLFEKETPFKIILTLDGDYMKMYIDEVSEENLFQTLIRTTPEACNQIEKWIKGESDDLSKVVMPKKLSVQNESSKATSSTNVSPNQTMLVSENLKLRSGEATTSDVITVMSVGTKVKILELGKAETIDGISSNWVKVEVQAGAKDRDGKTITKGTVGWCFGGYLKTGEYEESELFYSPETANETESEVKSIFQIRIEEISFIIGMYFTFIFFITLIVPFIYNTMKIIKSIKARKKGAGDNVPVLSLTLICAGCFFSAFAAFCLFLLTAVDVIDVIDVIVIIGVIASIFIYIVAGLVTIVGKIRKKKEAPGSLRPVIAGEVAMITGILFLSSNVVSYKQFIYIVMMMTLVVFAAGSMLITAGVLGSKVNKKEKIQE